MKIECIWFLFSSLSSITSDAFLHAVGLVILVWGLLFRSRCDKLSMACGRWRCSKFSWSWIWIDLDLDVPSIASIKGLPSYYTLPYCFVSLRTWISTQCLPQIKASVFPSSLGDPACAEAFLSRLCPGNRLSKLLWLQQTKHFLLGQLDPWPYGSLPSGSRLKLLAAKRISLSPLRHASWCLFFIDVHIEAQKESTWCRFKKKYASWCSGVNRLFEHKSHSRS